VKKVKIQSLRILIQSLFLLLALSWLAISVIGFTRSIHQFCPYAVVCFGLRWGVLLRLGGALMSGAIIFGFAVLVFTLFWGRKFCAWLCPLGTVQEWLFALRSRQYRLKCKLPFYADTKAAWLKYALMAATILLSIVGLGYVSIRLCPFYSLSLIPRIAFPGLILLILTLAASLFVSRPWCRFLWPYGALMNFFQIAGRKAGIPRKLVKRNLERCTDCGLCSLWCPMNINIGENEYVENVNCIHCGVCAEKCPKKGTINEESVCPKQL